MSLLHSLAAQQTVNTQIKLRCSLHSDERLLIFELNSQSKTVLGQSADWLVLFMAWSEQLCLFPNYRISAVYQFFFVYMFFF